MDLIQKLSEYCDKLVGEDTSISKGTRDKKKGNSNEKVLLSKKRKKRKDRSLANCEIKTCMQNTCDESGENIPVKSTLSKVEENIINTEINEAAVNNNNNKAKCLVTDDGFKVVSTIPEDDSDVSDAFESDIEFDEFDSQSCISINESKKSQPHGLPNKNIKTTDDGFKIISEIPADDSDVSDAFSEGEDDITDTGEDLLKQRNQIANGGKINKHMLKMMDDFGINNSCLEENKQNRFLQDNNKPTSISAIRNSKKKNKKKLNASSSIVKQPPEVTIYDYSKKQNNKSKKKKKLKKDPDRATMKEKINKEMKNLRFDVYKLGVTGFDKNQKRENREALAIKLGAVPRKKDYLKYKELIEQRKQERVEVRERRKRNKEMGIKENVKLKKKNPIKKKKAFAGQVGKYKDGVQFLSKKDIHRINRS